MQRSSKRPAARRHMARVGLACSESLESRRLLASVSVDLGQTIRPASDNMIATNLAWWQWELDTPRMEQMIRDAGLKLLRSPGGSSSNNNLHFNNPAPYGGFKTAPIIANVIEHVGADGMVTVNYGTGSPQEAAAFLAYYNAQAGDATAIGYGQQWDTSTSTWVQKDWMTAGYWAGLRAAAPLAVDDGLNFLRVSHPAPWNFTYWEVGNENFAIWENDKHGQGGDTGSPQDPATYVAFAKTFSDLAHQIDADVKVGLDVTLPMQWNLPDQQWTDHVLQQSASRGLMPGFLSDHVYIGGQTDQNLLLHTVNDPAFNDGWAPLNWPGRTQAYRTKLTTELGAAGAGVEIMLTEFNSDLGSKQSTSLVNGLFLADAVGGALQTEYSAAMQWDLTNGYGNMADDPSRYGWRTGSDNGMIGTGSGPLPATGAYVPYPTYFAEQLLSKVVHDGDAVVRVTSDDPYLSTYALQQANGHLGLLVVNKSATNSLSGTFSLRGFNPTGQAQFWQYGKAEDTAQSLSTDGYAALSSWSTTLSLSGASFTYSFPSYSMTAIDLTPVSLPAGWTAADIGAPALPGSTSYASGIWTLVGAGSDIWGRADQFQFASQSLAGNGSIVARVDSLTNTDGWAKAGVMLRDSSSAGATFADVVITPGNGVNFQWRSTTGGNCGNAQVTGQTAPKWVKLTRSGDTFSAYYSSNGTTWTPIGSPQRIYMGYSAMAGLAVTSHNIAQLATAAFSNVSVTAAPTTITVDAGQVTKTINNNALGINVSWWDTALNSTQTRDLVLAAGLSSFRFPGGSSSDEFHFAKPPEWGGKGTAATFAQFIESVGGGGMVTLNYGTGSPQEAAAFLAYLNASTTSTVSLGFGQQWDSTTSTWVQKDWKTAGYWASLRGAAKLATDDGLNFLRIGHPSPFAFRYFEVGNEVHGSWETDMHGSGGDTGRPHDAATYIAFSKQVAGYAQQIDPSAVVSIVVDGSNGWTTSVLQQCVSQGYTPKAVSDHTYMQGPGNESDAFLLMRTSADPASGFYWPTKATNIRNLLTSHLGATAGNAVEMLQTEFNSVYSNPGKQTTSLVNGLFLADSIGSLLKSGYNGGWMWDLRNGWDTSNNNSSSLYGWRMGGDYGILGSGNSAPASGTYIPYPTYFSEQLLSKMVHNGDVVVAASSNDPFLSTYAIRQANGHLSLLVINKADSASITGTFSLGGFTPSGQVQFWQYGKTEDTAQSLTTDGHSSLSTWTSTLSLNGSSFSYSFPAYSMTVMDLGQAAPPTVQSFSINGGAAQRSMVKQFNLVFSEPVTLGSGLDLRLHSGAAVANVTLVASSTDRQSYTITFSGSAVIGGSLPDGIYALTLTGSAVVDDTGNSVAGSSTWTFHRLFGDSDGNKIVNALDYARLKNTFARSASDPLFSSAFDYEGNNLINALDLARFRQRYGLVYSY